jgi:oleandomycin transport system ATP-binding protein
MPAVVRGLDREGIAVGELTLRRSSLDEVFLALTGHRAEPEQQPGRPDESAREADEAGRADAEQVREKAASPT